MPYNLIRESWVPARAIDGAICWVRPADLPRDGADLVDIEWGRPEFRIASFECLIGMFAVALADHLRDSGDWGRLFDAPPNDLDARLARLEPFFNLDGDSPLFLQDIEKLDGEPRPPDALLIDGPGAQTEELGADIFSKRDRFAVLSRKAAAIALYSMQAFAPSGGRGHRTSMRGGGPLTTLVIPENPTLWRRIVANLPLLVDDRELRAEADWGIVFPWLKSTRGSGDGLTTSPGEDAHFLQSYFGMPRRLRLVTSSNSRKLPCAITGEIDDVIVTGFLTAPWGVNYGVWRHPLSPYYRVKPGEPPLPVHAQGGRIGYRDWSAYLFRGADADLRAEQVGAFERAFPRQRSARLLAAGFVTDNMKCLDWAEGEAPLLLLANEYARARLAKFAHGRLLPAAGTVAFALRGALRDSLGVDDVQKTVIASAAEQFWTETSDAFFEALDHAEERLQRLGADVAADEVEAVDFMDLAEAWLKALRRAALAIFDATAPVERLADLDAKSVKRVVDAARSLRICLQGHGKLGRALFEALGLPPPARATTNATRRAGQSQRGATP